MNFEKWLKLLFDAQAFFLDPQLDAFIHKVSVKHLPGDEIDPLFAAGDTSANADSKQCDKKSKGVAMEKNSTGLLERIFLDYKTKIFSYMTWKGVPSFDKDDVFSEAMLKMAYNAEKFDNAKAPLSTWVYIVTRSVIADYFRKQKKDQMPLESLSTIFMYECIDIEFEAEQSELKGLLARLPEIDKRIIVMRLYDDMEYSEIAMRMNYSAGTLRQIYNRALKKLRELIGYEVD